MASSSSLASSCVSVACLRRWNSSPYPEKKITRRTCIEPTDFNLSGSTSKVNDPVVRKLLNQAGEIPSPEPPRMRAS